MRIETTIEIEASAEDTWAALTDLAAYPDWNPLTYRVEGELSPESLVTLRVRLGGRKMKRQHQVSRVTPPTAVETGALCWTILSNASWFIRGERCQRVVPLGENRCRYENEEVVEGLVGPIVQLFFGDTVRDGLEALSAALKTRLEIPDLEIPD